MAFATALLIARRSRKQFGLGLRNLQEAKALLDGLA